MLMRDLPIDHRVEHAKEPLQTRGLGLEQLEGANDRLEGRHVLGSRRLANSVARRRERTQREVRAIVQPRVRAVQVARLRPGTVEDDEGGGALFGGEIFEEAGVVSGEQHADIGLELEALFEAAGETVPRHHDARPLETELNDARRPDCMEPFARVLQHRHVRSIGDRFDQLTEAVGDGLEARVAANPDGPVAGRSDLGRAQARGARESARETSRRQSG